MDAHTAASTRSPTDQERGGATAVIQDRSRLYRDSLRLLLQHHDLVVTAVATPGELTVIPGSISAFVLEGDGVPWDVGALAADLRRRHGDVRILATAARTRHRHPSGDVVMVDRHAPSAALARAVRGEDPLPTRPEVAAATLTARELQVLSLISGGFTTAQIAARLALSVKTVEGKRQALFTKLGVQNQSAAVAAAIRSGLLGAAGSTPEADVRTGDQP